METLTDMADPALSTWKGCDLDQLRYLRALNMARRQIAGQQLADAWTRLTSGSETLSTVHRGILSKVVASLNYVDYAMMAFAVIRRLRHVLKRRHKK